jgi:hypothetical protein
LLKPVLARQSLYFKHTLTFDMRRSLVFDAAKAVSFVMALVLLNAFVKVVPQGVGRSHVEVRRVV